MCFSKQNSRVACEATRLGCGYHPAKPVGLGFSNPCVPWCAGLGSCNPTPGSLGWHDRDYFFFAAFFATFFTTFFGAGLAAAFLAGAFLATFLAGAFLTAFLGAGLAAGFFAGAFFTAFL
ncbi:MAG: hypothetical protein ACNA8L_13090, partial [Luteolibacter sp.]